MYKKIVEEWGTVGFVVNSAGVCLTEELTTQTLNDIDLSIDVNIKGTIYSCREALAIMRPKKYGKIVNMSSIAAKAAVLAATASLGREAARDKVWAEWTVGTLNRKPQDPIDIANMVAFLCSEEARYITSQNIGVDGGYTF